MNLFEIYFFISDFFSNSIWVAYFCGKIFDIMNTLLLVWLFYIRLHAEDKANNMI